MEKKKEKITPTAPPKLPQAIRDAKTEPVAVHIFAISSSPNRPLPTRESLFPQDLPCARGKKLYGGGDGNQPGIEHGNLYKMVICRAHDDQGSPTSHFCGFFFASGRPGRRRSTGGRPWWLTAWAATGTRIPGARSQGCGQETAKEGAEEVGKVRAWVIGGRWPEGAVVGEAKVGVERQWRLGQRRFSGVGWPKLKGNGSRTSCGGL